ncbi:hypothetical protein [Streptomyces hokutonensis]
MCCSITDVATFQIGPGGATVLETFGIPYDGLAHRLGVALSHPDGT